MAAPLIGEDWVELYNMSTQPVDLSGLYLTDDPSAGRSHEHGDSLAELHRGPEYTALFLASGSASDAPNGTNFKLATEGESLRLYSTALVLLDGVDFGLVPSGVSRGRYPDGTANVIDFTSTASPDAPNYLDSDDDGLPDAWELANGLEPYFSDAEEDADGDGRSNRLEFLAGTDPRSASSGMTSSVEPAEGGGFAVRFTAQIGKTYTVQWKDQLNDPTWQKLVDVPSGAQRNVEAIDPTAATARFYRVVTPLEP